MQFRSYVTAISLFWISLVLAVSCTNPATQMPSGSSPSPAAASNSVRLGFAAWPGWVPWQVAQEEQLFAANNAKVDLRWFDGLIESIHALAAGQLDANNQTLSDTISSVAAGADQVVVLVNDNSTGNDAVIVSQDINSIADLKGKKVAAEEGTVDHFLLLLGLKQEGLTGNDIQLVPLETGKAAAAFVAGQVDAVAAYAPFTIQALKRPASKVLFSSKEFPGAIPDHVVVSRKLINDKPEQVQALVNTWFATLDFVKANREKAYAIMAKRAGVSVEEYKAFDAGTKIFTVEENLKAFQPGNDMTSLPYAAQQISTFLVEAGLAKTKPDLTRLFDDRFVKAYADKIKSRT